MTAAATVEVAMVAPEVVRPLRATVLRPGLPPEASVYPTDDQADAGHAAATLAGRVVGVGSLAREAMPDRPELTVPVPRGRSWRLRGMAVADGHRGCGIGAVVLARLVRHAVDHGADLLWANARDGAVAFYLANGWEVVSAGFELPDIGGHHVMVHRLAPPPGPAP